MILSRLKEHRKRRGLTQIELALISGVGRATIAALETGKRSRVHPATRAKLAKALKVRPERLEEEKHGTHRQAEAEDSRRAAAQPTAQRRRSTGEKAGAGASAQA